MPGILPVLILCNRLGPPLLMPAILPQQMTLSLPVAIARAILSLKLKNRLCAGFVYGKIIEDYSSFIFSIYPSFSLARAIMRSISAFRAGLFSISGLLGKLGLGAPSTGFA